MSASSSSACTPIVTEPLHQPDWSFADDGQPTTYVRTQTQVQHLLRMTSDPWTAVKSIPESLQALVMNILQQELDAASHTDPYYSTSLRCLRVLSKDRGILPSSLICQEAIREGTHPVSGGGFADIWKGRLHENPVCLKVLRVFIAEQAREKLIRDFCQEAFVWKLLRHPNVLPFLGVNANLFSPSYCLISPWMANGNIISYLEAHPDHDRYTSLVQISQGMQYLHSLDPQIVHADIRGANILVTDDIRCCLADFGLSLIVESQMLDSTSRMRKGAMRWLAPEYIDLRLLDKSCLAARDIYAFGCTIVEIFTGKPPFSNIKNEIAVIYEVAKGNHPPRPSPSLG
ncbi:uncharacterized protein ARMOST_13951 [Armillaria ostoyae]|uniref:Protein kinase domain-containing protein n=1 Tax=Armillaria ostoyae TaxID=47428 RepID=A0A284RPA2_ARMOS|nr:uncharacterized protein ARMOST_13951 [Armillaria ostoyae]